MVFLPTILRFWPVAELKTFFFEHVCFADAFDFDAFTRAVQKGWEEQVQKAKDRLDERKRKLDELLVDTAEVEAQRPYKRARKDV
jgi:hypothetical protein